jgi:hypothetical protein
MEQQLGNIFAPIHQQVEQVENFKSPQEELEFLRAELKRREEELAAKSIEIKKEEIAQHMIEQYKQTPIEKALEPKNITPSDHHEGLVLRLKPEKHDDKIEFLLNNLLSKGIRNTMDLVEKMNDPHIDDDFYRFLVQYLASYHEVPGLRPESEFFKTIDVALFEVTLPENDTQKNYREMITLMEQFYAGMQSIGPGENKNRNFYTLEMALSNTGNQVVFYVCVPRGSAELFEKQVLGLYREARINEVTDDYNIFNQNGVSSGSYAVSTKSDLLMIKTYDKFDHDPMNVLLNTFSKLKSSGEGAALQIIVEPVGDKYIKDYGKKLEQIKKGTKLKDLDGDGWGKIIGKETLGWGRAAFNVLTGSDVTGNDDKSGDKKEEEKKIDEDAVRNISEKITSSIQQITIRIITSSETQERSEAILRDIESAFIQLTDVQGNGLKFERMKKNNLNDFLHQYSYRYPDPKQVMHLNLKEVATLFHFPAHMDGSAQLKQSGSAQAPAPDISEMDQNGIVIGENEYRGNKTQIRMAREDRLRHLYTIGQTGVGKTQLFLKMIIQDIHNGDGCCFVDPHGSDINTILANIPPERMDDVVYFDPSYIDRPMGLNMMEFDERFPQQKSLVIGELMGLFDKLFDMKAQGGAMFGQYFRNSALLNMEDPASGNTVLEITRVLANEQFRKMKLSKCKNPIIAEFWKSAEATSGEQGLENFVPYISSKFDDFISNEFLRPVILQEKSAFNFREIMDNKKILIINLSKGLLGEKNANLIGLIIIMKLQMAAMSRADSPDPSVFPPFYVYLDEFQNVVTESISAILSEACKYKLILNMTHQFMGQLPDYIKSAVFGNVGNMLFFRISSDDAVTAEPRVAPKFTKDDIVKQENANAIASIMVHGKPMPAFNINTIADGYAPKGNPDQVQQVKQLSYLKYGRPRAEIEAEIMEKYRMF